MTKTNKICKCGDLKNPKLSYCKLCKNRYYAKHAVEIRKKAAEWAKNNKDIIAEYKRVYHDKNKDKIRDKDILKTKRLNHQTLPSAKHHRQSWTSHDFVIATLKGDNDTWLLTAEQSALLLGRTFYSIKNIRKTNQTTVYNLHLDEIYDTP